MRVRRAACSLGLGLLACLALGGCSLPDYLPPQPPPFLQEMADAAARASLGQPVGEPVPDGPALSAAPSLADLIRMTLQGDPKIRAAAQEIPLARAELWTASLPPNPTLTTSITLLPLTRPFTVDRQGGPPQLDVGVSFPIDWLVFGKRARAMDSARAGVDVAAAEFADQVRQRVSGTVTAYFDVLEARALLDLGQKDVATLRRVVTLTEQRAKLGGVGEIEIDRARLAVLEAEREALRRETALATARAILRAQVGRADADPSFEVQGNLEVPAPLEPPPLEEAFQLAQQYRPDLIARRLDVSQAEAELRSQRAQACPAVTPRAGYTRQFQEQAIGFPDASSWGVGLDLELPILKRNQGGILKAQASLAKAQYNAQTQLVEVRSQVEQAVQELRTAQAAVSTNAPARVKSAQSVLDRLESAYKAGGRTLLEVLDAQRAYREAMRQYIMDQASYWRALYKLNAAIGRQVLR